MVNSIEEDKNKRENVNINENNIEESKSENENIDGFKTYLEKTKEVEKLCQNRGYEK